MSIKNILSKILGLDRKEKTEPVEPTSQTQQPSADPPPPPAPIHPSTHPTIQPPSAPPPLIQSSIHPLIQAPARRLTGKIAKLPLEIRIIINQMLDEAETYKS